MPHLMQRTRAWLDIFSSFPLELSAAHLDCPCLHFVKVGKKLIVSLHSDCTRVSAGSDRSAGNSRFHTEVRLINRPVLHTTAIAPMVARPPGANCLLRVSV